MVNFCRPVRHGLRVLSAPLASTIGVLRASAVGRSVPIHVGNMGEQRNPRAANEAAKPSNDYGRTPTDGWGKVIDDRGATSSALVMTRNE
jgi:hypothetical protein